MKKFLSVLLAVMMVLSTVSFAAPSAVSTMDMGAEVSVDYADVVEATEAAELAAVITDKSAYGTLIYKVDFENDNFDVAGFSTAYKQLKDGTTASYINPAFDTGNATCYTNAAGDGFKNAQLVTEGGNTYIKGDVNAGYSGFFRMTKYNCAWPEGYYTFAVDVKLGNAISSWAKQCNDTAIATKPIVACDVASTDWQTVVEQTANVVNGADIYGFFVTPNNASAGTISYDNWEVYYRPATVTLTIGGVDYEISTDSAVTAESLASKVVAPTGYTLAGVSLTEGGELLTGSRYFFEDTTLYPVFEKDTTIHETYGKPLFIIDFENEAAQTWWGHSEYDNSTCSWGAQVWTVANKYDARFDKANFRVRFITNEGTHGNQGVAVDENGNHYNKGTTLVQWPNLSVSNWGNVMGEAGVYTYVFDRMISGASSVSAASPAGIYEVVDGYDGVQGVWDKVVLQHTLETEAKIPDGNLANFSLAAADKGVAEIAYDNFILYYKPLTADVTLIAGGKEYVANDVATTGVSASSILEMAGVPVPYGKKPVLSATVGGESVGNVINLIMDSTFYVSYVDDDSIHPVYGKRMLLVDFENLTSVTDLGKVSVHTDDYDVSFANATINWEAGVNAVVEENGNKFLKGQQGWAQVRINNANYASLPAGKYTMVLKSKNYGYPSETKQIASKDQKAGINGTMVDPFVDNGEWDEVVASWDYSAEDYSLYYTAPMSTDVAFDDIALYYMPASVELTIVNGDESFTKTVANGVTAEELLADVAVPFGYKVALSTTGDASDVLTGALSLVSNTTLYVVNIPDETVSFDYGKALFVIDFEKASMQGWDGNSQTLDNSVAGNGVMVYESASYYDPRFQGTNYRVRFVINETTGLIDQKIVADENGNHYTTGTNTSRWPQVCSTNWGNIQGDAGVYTFMFDVKVEETTETSLAMSNGTIPNVVSVDPFCAEAGDWDTVIVQTTMDAAGNLPKGTWSNFNFAANETTTLSFDNAKLFFKPFNATVEVMANGKVEATKENVSTSGVLVSSLVEGIKVKGYKVVGAKLGTEVYGLEDTMNIPCDCTVELVLEVQETPAATPETSELTSVRVADPMGIRFKASLSKAEDSTITDYGWIVARASVLGTDELTIEMVGTKKAVAGYGRQNGTPLKKFYETTDEYNVFTGVLYFSATEDDGYPEADRLADKLVARPFAVVDGEYLYGEATAPKSIYDAAVALWESDAWNDLDESVQEYLDGLMVKVIDAGLGA